MGIVTLASFTCQRWSRLENRTEQNQRFRELDDVAYPVKNRLFLGNVTMPSDRQIERTAAEIGHQIQWRRRRTVRISD
jgi:hypothetical protein